MSIKNSLRWGQLVACSRRSGVGRLSLVIHCEGLVNGRIYQSLKMLGSEMEQAKPGLAVITPFCPMYHVDPLKDPLRTSPSSHDVGQSELTDFRLKLEGLADRFTIGYHGHFFSEAAKSSQFDIETDYLRDIGFMPEFYAGGWWLIDQPTVERLKEKKILCDTTLNDVGADSFGNGQPKGLMFGPVKSLVSVRSPGSWRKAEDAVLATHDYDLLFRLRGRGARFFDFQRMVTFEEMAS